MSTTNSILSDQPADVKAENLLKQVEASGVKPSEMVAVVQNLYPGYDRFLHSKCKNGEQYGIMLRPDATSAIITRFAPELRNSHRRDVRTKPRRIQARLSEALYGALQRRLQALGITTQQWIEDLALALIAQEGEKDGH